MNYSKLFYWLVVADNMKSLFTTFIVIFTAIAAISTIAYFICAADSSDPDNPDHQAMARKWMWWSYPFAILFWMLQIATPSKKDSLLIVAGGQTLNFLTSDSTAKQIPHELSNFVLVELKNMAKDADVELGIKDQKEKILNEAKSMTSDELIERMGSDSNFAKIILNK
jgi:hypothetical protein